MNISEAKNIPFTDYLQSHGIIPCKKQGNNLWYYSPFREETYPSFKVNPVRNEWYDFGLGKGGNILDFVMEQHGTDNVSCALQIITVEAATITPVGSFSFRPQESLPCFEDIRIYPLNNTALLQYLAERKIPAQIAVQSCKEIHFTCGGKRYFAIGFENDLGGYELRNRYFQGCLSPKNITSVKNGNGTCCIFEGFMDYLSYLAMKEKHSTCGQHNMAKERDYVILNSVANLSKALGIIESYHTRYCYLDNDTAGIRAWQTISDRCSLRTSNQSTQYSEYKDLNDYLRGIKMKQTQQKQRGIKL